MTRVFDGCLHPRLDTTDSDGEGHCRCSGELRRTGKGAGRGCRIFLLRRHSAKTSSDRVIPTIVRKSGVLRDQNQARCPTPRGHMLWYRCHIMSPDDAGRRPPLPHPQASGCGADLRSLGGRPPYLPPSKLGRFLT
jgi:hypothetical protein